MVLSRSETGLTLVLPDRCLTEASGGLNEKEEMANDARERSAGDDKILRYITYLFIEHANRALTKDLVYMELKSWEMFVTYKP